jgi:hypothetical protein
MTEFRPCVDGSVAFGFAPDGLVCRIDLALPPITNA